MKLNKQMTTCVFVKKQRNHLSKQSRLYKKYIAALVTAVCMSGFPFTGLQAANTDGVSLDQEGAIRIVRVIPDTIHIEIKRTSDTADKEQETDKQVSTSTDEEKAKVTPTFKVNSSLQAVSETASISDGMDTAVLTKVATSEVVRNSKVSGESATSITSNSNENAEEAIPNEEMAQAMEPVRVVRRGLPTEKVVNKPKTSAQSIKSGTTAAKTEVENQTKAETQVPVNTTEEGLAQTAPVTGKDIIKQEGHVLVPVDLFIEATPYKVTANQYKSAYTIDLPYLTLDAAGAIERQTGHVVPVRLPLQVIDGHNFIDVSNREDLLGLSLKESINQAGVSSFQLTTSKKKLTLPAWQEVAQPLRWAFDPLVSDAYEAPLGSEGTTIVSPSLFQLETGGSVHVSSKVKEAYVSAYKEMGGQVWPLVANQFNDQAVTKAILANKANWPSYAQTLINYAYMYGYSGYNFDFENVNYGSKTALTEFVTYLAAMMRKYHLYTSIDVTGYSDSPDWSLVYDRTTLGQAVDYVVLMAYDETWASSTKAGPVASFPWVKTNMLKLLQEVPANKLVLGIPFYMRTWTQPIVNGILGKAKSKTLSMTDSLDVISQYKSNIVWNSKLKTNYLAYEVAPNGKVSPLTIVNEVNKETTLEKGQAAYTVKKPTIKNGQFVQIWFEDKKSLAYKLALVRVYHLAGFAAWRKNFEPVSIDNQIRQTSLVPKLTVNVE